MKHNNPSLRIWGGASRPASPAGWVTLARVVVTCLVILPAGASACTWSFANPATYQDGFKSTIDCGIQVFLTSPAQQFGSTCLAPTKLVSDGDGVWLNPATVCSSPSTTGAGIPNTFNLSASVATTITTLLYGWRDSQPPLPVTATLACPGGSSLQVVASTGFPETTSGDFAFPLPTPFVIPASTDQTACTIQFTSTSTSNVALVEIKAFATPSPPPPPSPSPPPPRPSPPPPSPSPPPPSPSPPPPSPSPPPPSPSPPPPSPSPPPPSPSPPPPSPSPPPPSPSPPPPSPSPPPPSPSPPPPSPSPPPPSPSPPPPSPSPPPPSPSPPPPSPSPPPPSPSPPPPTTPPPACTWSWANNFNDLSGNDQIAQGGYTDTSSGPATYCGAIEATASAPTVPPQCPPTSVIPRFYNSTDDTAGGIQLTTSTACSTAASPALTAVTFTFSASVTLRTIGLGLRQAAEPLPLTIKLTVGSTVVSTVIPDDGSWTPGTRNTERDYQLSAPLPVPANTPCILEVQGSGTATDSYFEFNKFSELETGPLPDLYCFPASATVHVEGRGAVAMEHLRAGDRLLALDHRTGRLAFRPLYIFVHREPAVSGVFTNIECAPLGPGGAAGAGNATRRLQLSPRHFLPVCASGEAAACGPPRLGGLADSLRSSAAGWQHRYGGEVAPGMLVLVADGADQVAPAVVLRVWQSVERGLFNPLVEGGTLVVDGVLASDQSDWILDDLVPARWRHHLPGLYGIIMSPLRLLSWLLGPERLERLDAALGITWLGLNHGRRLLAALPATAVAGAVAAVLATRRRRDGARALQH